MNEAFAVQSLACIDAWGIDPTLVNANGGAFSLGHPLGAFRGRILGTLAKRLALTGERSGPDRRTLWSGRDPHRDSQDPVVLETSHRRSSIETAVLCVDPDEAVAGITTGSVVLIGGFRVAGSRSN